MLAALHDRAHEGLHIRHGECLWGLLEQPQRSAPSVLRRHGAPESSRVTCHWACGATAVHDRVCRHVASAATATGAMAGGGPLLVRCHSCGGRPEPKGGSAVWRSGAARWSRSRLRKCTATDVRVCDYRSGTQVRGRGAPRCQLRAMADVSVPFGRQLRECPYSDS